MHKDGLIFVYIRFSTVRDKVPRTKCERLVVLRLVCFFTKRQFDFVPVIACLGNGINKLYLHDEGEKNNNYNKKETTMYY